MEQRIRELISQMTLEEKASLCSGEDFWHTKSVERLGIPQIMVADGPHGLRKETGEKDKNRADGTVRATCFPTAAATGSSWDTELMRQIGEALAEECLQEGVSVILGPGANIKRSPLCGRNFEYISEDPYLTGEMAAALIGGVQSRGVGTSLKHYAVNSQETLRFVVDAVVDDRALREIYLTGFEKAVRQAQPWTVMCSYNRVQGTYASENSRLLTGILKNEWKHEGLVVSDWGAVNERVEGLKAGLELEMPGTMGQNDAKIVKAVRDGDLDEGVLDEAVGRLLALVFRASENLKPGYRYDAEAHHALARRAAAESAVLLKNDGLLPLDKSLKIALIGKFAQQPRYQGGGSSHIQPIRMESALDEFQKRGISFTYARGYDLKSAGVSRQMLDEAAEAARRADVAVVYAGLPERYESEGYDRDHLDMPESHNLLIARVAEANPNVVVLLQNGAPVTMPWISGVNAVIELYLGGQAGGPASVDILYGDVNPSGKLAESFPLSLSDTPCAKWFPGSPLTGEYRESIYVGYRYYDTARKEVLFPFGHGLSYTEFEYSDLVLSSPTIGDNDELTVTVTVENTGRAAGAEVVQLYVSDPESAVFKPEQELKGFRKVFLEPGGKAQVEFNLGMRAFAFYNTAIGDWYAESGVYHIRVGSSSRDIRLSKKVMVESAQPAASVPDYAVNTPHYFNLQGKELNISDGEFEDLVGYTLPVNEKPANGPYDWNSTVGDIQNTPVGRLIYKIVLSNVRKAYRSMGVDDMAERVMVRMAQEMPLRSIFMMSSGRFRLNHVQGLLLILNKKPLRGIIRFLNKQ